ncbi:MAG TPA: hypothetical protein VFL14_10425, partial [Xanthomonadales bacterium]|nr:hypothetical protein [Xanthomonadales bacterium]
MMRTERAPRLAAVVLAVAGVALAYAAVRAGHAQLALRDARDALLAAASGRDDASPDAARAALERAIARDPADAELREVHGRWALRDAAQADEPAAARAAAAIAVRDFRAALAARPQWPYAWSGLATALSGEGAEASAVAEAAEAAVRFGRNE